MHVRIAHVPVETDSDADASDPPYQERESYSSSELCLLHELLVRCEDPVRHEQDGHLIQVVVLLGRSKAGLCGRVRHAREGDVRVRCGKAVYLVLAGPNIRRRAESWN